MQLPPETDWERRPSSVPESVVAALLDGADAQRLPGGLVNLNLRCGDRVLRIYSRGATVAAVEWAILAQVPAEVPVPRVLDSGTVDGWPYAWLEAMPGHGLADVLAEGVDGRPYAFALGQIAAALHRHRLPAVGFLGVSLEVTEALGPAFFGEALDGWLDGLAGRRLGEGRCAQLRRVVPPHDVVPVLLHGDYKPTNILVDGDQVTAVLDWEFAWSGPALTDLGQLLRWEDHVPAGFADAVAQGYGELAPDWRAQAMTLDLLNLVGFLADEKERPRLFADVLGRIDRSLTHLW